MPNDFFIMFQGKNIRVYQYWQNENEDLDCEISHDFELGYSIKDIKIFPSPKSLKEKDFYLIAENA